MDTKPTNGKITALDHERTVTNDEFFFALAIHTPKALNQVVVAVIVGISFLFGALCGALIF